MTVDFVMSHIAQSRGLRTESFQAPMRFELPREVVEEALVNALVHRDWRLSASVEVRLFADRVEIWNPGALPEGITIPKLYETHSSYPVNELVLKVFDFAGVIESLGTGIKRMIETCRKERLPDPTWEQNGSSFVVTIWKDMWTEARLRELGLSERQKKAVRWLKVNRHIAASDYMSLTHVARNTATRDLNKLVAFGVLVAEGSGKYSFYSLKRLCTINAPYAPSSVKVTKDVGNLAVLHGNANGKSHLKAREGINEGLNDGINEGIKFDVFRLILERPGCRVPFLAKALSVSRATVERAVAALIIIGKIEHRGSKKTGGYYVVSGKESGDGLV